MTCGGIGGIPNHFWNIWPLILSNICDQILRKGFGIGSIAISLPSKFIFVPDFFFGKLLWKELKTHQTPVEDADDIAKRIASRAKNAIEEGSWGYYKNFGTWNYEG